MGRRSNKFLTLQQAAAWVVFRTDAAVEYFDPKSGRDWKTFMFYPSMWPDSYEEVGSSLELFDALKDGRIRAYGHHIDAVSPTEEIPEIEWQRLVPEVEGPYFRHPEKGKIVPWLDIIVLRADVEKLWRRASEVEGRSKFTTRQIGELYDEASERLAGASKNDIYAEVEQLFQDKYKKSPPSRTTIQRHVKKWLTSPHK